MSTKSVVIPADVYVQLQRIRRSGVVNMMDHGGIQYHANRREFFATVVWMEDNANTYAEGFFKGFEPDRALTDDEQDAIESEGSDE